MGRGSVPSLLEDSRGSTLQDFSRLLSVSSVDAGSMSAPSFPLATSEALREDRVGEVVYFPHLPELMTILVIEGDTIVRS